MVTADEINALKQKVKTEMARRSGYGSLAMLAGATNDFASVPAPGKRILAEHGQKTINPLLQVADVPGLVLVDGQTPEGDVPSTTGDIIPAAFDAALLSYTDALSAEPMSASQSSCRGACSGLCVGTCTDSCSGCGASCNISCSGCSGCSSCTGGCGSGCTGGCYGGGSA